MKCLNCSNDIPDASIVCPFCGSKVEPMGRPTPVFNLETTSSLPVTPSAPVLPQDQGIEVTQNINTVSTVENASNMMTNESLSMSSNSGNVGSLEQGINTNEAATNLEPQMPVVDQQLTSSNNLEVQNPTINGSANNQATLENAINPTYINPDGGIVDGGKIGSSVAPTVKNKNKKKLIIILIVIAFVLVVGGLAFAYYYSQYKTADKRVSSVFKGITSMTSNLRNENVDKASGTYNVDLSIDYNDESIKTKIDGTYARDLSAGAIDLTSNVQSFIKGEELLNNPINFEIYYNDSKIYVLLENFFDMYIYDEFDGLDTYFESIEQNNINYVDLVSSVKRAINSGLTNMGSTQTVKKVNIHGVSSKVNAVQIRFNSRNQGLFTNAFCRVLANDTTFVSEMAKLTNKDEESIKEQINNVVQEKEYKDIDLTIEVYTEMFGEKFLGLKITTKENFINKLTLEEENDEVKVIELYPINNGYGLTYKNGSQNVFEGTYEKTSKRTSTTNESSYKIYFTLYYGGVAYKVDTSLNLVGDVNPKDAKVNVKNSINKIYLTEENKAAILEKYSQSGNFALHYPDILNKYLSVSENNLTPNQASQDSCLLVTNCQVSSFEGYSICKSQENTDVICQNDWIGQGN